MGTYTTIEGKGLEQRSNCRNSIYLASSPYTWVSDVYMKRNKFKPDSATQDISFVDCLKSSTGRMPPDESALVNLLSVFEESYEERFPGVLMMLERYMLAVHYETVIDELEQVPATFLIWCCCVGSLRELFQQECDECKPFSLIHVYIHIILFKQL